VTSLRFVAMGLLIVLLDSSYDGWDLLADPAGWALVVGGVLPLAERLGGRTVLTAVLAFVTSLVVYPPEIARAVVDPAAGWTLSLPQLAFVVVLCLALAARLPDLERRLRNTAIVVVVVALAPVVVLAAGPTVWSVGAVAFAAVLTQLYVVYLLFKASSAVPGEAPEHAERAAP
jgi:hypothetical protein